jgi:hypothetical protein
VVGIAVGIIGMGHRLALGLVKLYIRFYMVRNHVISNMGSGWHCSWYNRNGAQVGTGVGKTLYSILHGPKSCNFEYGQRLALKLVKSEMGVIFDSTWSEII